MNDGEFAETPLRTSADYVALLERLRPLTATVEFVFPYGDDAHPLADVLRDCDPARTVGVGVRPGYARPMPRAVLLRCQYHRDLFAVLRNQEGFFRYVPGKRGDRVEPTIFGLVDVTFLDADQAVLCYTVTHEGLVFERRRPG